MCPRALKREFPPLMILWGICTHHHPYVPLVGLLIYEYGRPLLIIKLPYHERENKGKEEGRYFGKSLDQNANPCCEYVQITRFRNLMRIKKRLSYLLFSRQEFIPGFSLQLYFLFLSKSARCNSEFGHEYTIIWKQLSHLKALGHLFSHDFQTKRGNSTFSKASIDLQKLKSAMGFDFCHVGIDRASMHACQIW